MKALIVSTLTIMILIGKHDTEGACNQRPCFGVMCSVGCRAPKRIGSMVPTESCPTYPVGSHIIYKCDDQYLPATGASYCQMNSQWTTPKMTCRRITCGTPPQYPGFKTNARCFTVNCKAKISCDEKMTRRTGVTCSRHGKWTKPKCHVHLKHTSEAPSLDMTTLASERSSLSDSNLDDRLGYDSRIEERTSLARQTPTSQTSWISLTVNGTRSNIIGSAGLDTMKVNRWIVIGVLASCCFLWS